MAEMVAVLGDKNDHGNGDLLCDNNPGKAFIGGKLVALLNCSAASDNLNHPTGSTNPSSASSKVFVGGIPVHRNNDSRFCGAKTIVTNQSKVTCG